MTVSILMPVYNAEPYLSTAIEAVTSRPDADMELVVIDDGSSDKSAAVIRGFAEKDARIRYASRANKGEVATRNELIKMARGDYIAWADADDIRSIDMLLEQVEFLERNHDFIAACGGFSMISEDGWELSPLNSGEPSKDITDELLDGEVRTTLCTYVIRRSACKDLSFRPWFESAEDVDFQFRLAERGRVFFMRGDYYRYRLRPNSVTHTLADNRRTFFHEAAISFARQRRESGTDDLERGHPPRPPEGSQRSQSHADHQARILVGESWRQFGRGDRRSALRTMFRAVRARPLRIGLWRQFVVMLLKTAGRTAKDPT